MSASPGRFVTRLRHDAERGAMQGSERDPEAIVRRLLQSERPLSAGARDEVLALGAGAVPALLRILDDEVLEGCGAGPRCEAARRNEDRRGDRADATCTR